jgi:hypothetical protein
MTGVIEGSSLVGIIVTSGKVVEIGVVNSTSSFFVSIIVGFGSICIKA